jgi:NADPH2:quinone reductase
VLILGATGAMGLLLTQLARAAGGRVLAALRVAGAPRGGAKAEQARAAGAEAVIDYSEPDWAQRVAEVTGGAGPAVVLDGVGATLGVAAFATLADGGRFSGHGAAAGGFAPVDRDEAGRRGITVQGIEQAHFPPGGHEKFTAQALAEVAAGRLRPVIGQSYPLERAADAHRGLEGRTALGKTLLMVNEGAA